MKRLALAFFAVALIAPTTASSFWRTPKLNQVASVFAMRKVQVRCFFTEERGSPEALNAWGYVETPTRKSDWTALAESLCVGAENLNDRNLPVWQRALGVLVLVHESYHLRRWSASDHEGQVECKAIRHWKVAARLLGASEETVTELWPFAVAAHFKLTNFQTFFGTYPYKWDDCEVPDLMPSQ